MLPSALLLPLAAAAAFAPILPGERVALEPARARAPPPVACAEPDDDAPHDDADDFSSMADVEVR